MKRARFLKPIPKIIRESVKTNLTDVACPYCEAVNVVDIYKTGKHRCVSCEKEFWMDALCEPEPKI